MAITFLSSKTVITFLVSYTNSPLLKLLELILFSTQEGLVNGYVSITKGVFEAFLTNWVNASEVGDSWGILPKSFILRILNEFSVKFLIYGVTNISLLYSW